MGASEGRSGPSGLGFAFLAVIGAIALVVFSVTLLLGLTITGSVAEGLDDTKDPFNTTSSPDPETGTAVSFEDTSGSATILEVFQVRDTTNTSINLTGADDSFMESQAAFEVSTDDTWSVCTWASVAPGAESDNMTAISANGRVLIQYDGSTSNWSIWHFDDGSSQSWRANVSAPNQPGNFSHICGIHNGTHLTAFRNTTEGDSVSTETNDSIADVNVDSGNWNGRIDETRLFDQALNSSQRSALHDYGVRPLPNATRTARITYDEGSGSTTEIYFADTRADLSNITWDDGLTGSVLEEGTDYEMSTSAGTITALSGGLIDGAPVVWIDYRYEPRNAVGNVAEAIRPAFGLFATAALAIPAVVVLGMLVSGLIGSVFLLRNSEVGELLPGRRRGGGR